MGVGWCDREDDVESPFIHRSQLLPWMFCKNEEPTSKTLSSTICHSQSINVPRGLDCVNGLLPLPSSLRKHTRYFLPLIAQSHPFSFFFISPFLPIFHLFLPFPPLHTRREAIVAMPVPSGAGQNAFDETPLCIRSSLSRSNAV